MILQKLYYFVMHLWSKLDFVHAKFVIGARRLVLRDALRNEGHHGEFDNHIFH